MACISVLGGQTAPITLSRRRRRDVSGARPVWRLLLVRDRSSRRSCQQLLLVREKNTAERETRSTDGGSGRRNDTSVSDPTTHGATNVLGVRRLVGARAAVPVAGRTEPPTAHARSHDRERARQGVGAPGSSRPGRWRRAVPPRALQVADRCGVVDPHTWGCARCSRASCPCRASNNAGRRRAAREAQPCRPWRGTAARETKHLARLSDMRVLARPRARRQRRRPSAGRTPWCWGRGDD